MQAVVAEAVARSTREQAVADARRDIQELRRRAVEAGRDRSRRIIKTSRIDTRTGEIRYNPAGRLLRDWYLHVYMNTLRARLGEPAVTIDAQQVEDTTARLRRIRPASGGLEALRATGVVRDVAVDDAAHAAADIVAHLGSVAARRAVLHAGDDRFGGDQLSVHVSRHWYQRCYADQVHGATRSRQPLAEVTNAEEHQVVLTLGSGEARRLIGPDGIPLVTAHATMLTSLDRRLAAGAAGLVSPISDVEHHTEATRVLRERVTRTWSALAPDERRQWLRLAEVNPDSAGTTWSSLNAKEQTGIIRLYLATHRPGELVVPFRGSAIDQEPRLAAVTMFNHHAPLDGIAGSMPREHYSAMAGVAAVDADLGQERTVTPRSTSTEVRS